MVVTAIVVGCVLVVAGLACWVVVCLDRRATLRSVRFHAKAWKSFGVELQIERDADEDDPTGHGPPSSRPRSDSARPRP